MTLVDTIVARGDSARLTRVLRVASVLFLTALTAAAAQISIAFPFTEIPFTLQPLVVLLGGLALGPRLAVAAQMIYLAAGISGLPVFAPSAVLPPGAGRLLGPTGGYLMAYPLAACVAGVLASRGFDRSYGRSIVAMLAGLAVVFAGGVLWLAQFVGLHAALALGFYPFVLLDALKVVAAASVMPAVRKVIGAP